MSRIGKKEIVIPNNIEVEITASIIEIVGNKERMSYKIPNSITIEKQKNIIKLKEKYRNSKSQSLYGLSRSIINNMIIGVSEGFEKKLEIRGVGYRSQIEDKALILNVGYSHPVKIEPPKDISIKVENNTHITIRGVNKETVGQMAATIRNIRPPEPYKEKGIKYEHEVIRKKVGKAGK